MKLNKSVILVLLLLLAFTFPARSEENGKKKNIDIEVISENVNDHLGKKYVYELRKEVNDCPTFNLLNNEDKEKSLFQFRIFTLDPKIDDALTDVTGQSFPYDQFQTFIATVITFLDPYGNVKYVSADTRMAGRARVEEAAENFVMDLENYFLKQYK